MPVPSAPMHYSSLVEIADLIRSSRISPVELTLMMLDRVKQLDPDLHCFAYVTTELAINSARKAEQEIQKGHYKGPLHGIPVAVKDLCYTRDIPTSGGLRVLSHFIPDYDATVISKLKSAGAVILGKLTLTEGAVGGYHRDFPIPRNPWGHDLWTGSSSSGSGVAVAAGLCYAALGSDTGGSIRFPAMACGVTGLKPTYGRVSRYGILPLAETLDHVGPLARTVGDAALALDAISGPDAKDPTSVKQDPVKIWDQMDHDISGLRIGYDPQYTAASVDERLITCIEAALNELKTTGAELVEVQVPDVSEIREIWKIICTYEAARAHSANYPSRAAEYGDFFRDFLEFGFNTSVQSYREAVKKKDLFIKKLNSVWSAVDILACPGAGVPCRIPEGLLYRSMDEIRSFLNPYTYFQFTIPANFAGLPSLSFPCGTSALGPPYTMQLIGPEDSEAVLCSMGVAYQKLTSWHTNFPGI